MFYDMELGRVKITRSAEYNGQMAKCCTRPIVKAPETSLVASIVFAQTCKDSLLTTERREFDKMSSAEVPVAAVKQGPPADIFEAVDRDNGAFITFTAKRTVEFDVNQVDQNGWTALHWAAETGKMKALDALISIGADVGTTDTLGRTAVHLAARELHTEVLKVLMAKLEPEERKVLANQGDNFGITPLFLSRQKQM
eukprot:gene639-2075_t